MSMLPMDENKLIWQVLFEHPVSGQTTLHSWWTDQQAAEKIIVKDDILSTVHSWIESGTEYIAKRCEGCGSVFCHHRYDYYGNRAGYWCETCYASEDCPVQKTAYSEQ